MRLTCFAKTRELLSHSAGSPRSTAIEHRRAIRCPLQVPASLSWVDEERIFRHGEGQTRNIGEKGAFVDAAICPPIGSTVEVRFSLPALSNSGRGMYVQHTGEVLRLEGRKQGAQIDGFAITSREVVWRLEDVKDVGPSEKAPD
jgi:hypothetical protein